jgi:hypothetical protein
VTLKELRKNIGFSNESHVIEFMEALNKRKYRWRKMMQLKIEEMSMTVKAN